MFQKKRQSLVGHSLYEFLYVFVLMFPTRLSTTWLASWVNRRETGPRKHIESFFNSKSFPSKLLHGRHRRIDTCSDYSCLAWNLRKESLKQQNFSLELVLLVYINVFLSSTYHGTVLNSDFAPSFRHLRRQRKIGSPVSVSGPPTLPLDGKPVAVKR